jgi:hypothetical protein
VPVMPHRATESVSEAQCECLGLEFISRM